ncbi:porin [Flavobacterium crocinum]|uniref:Porin n=1 Tax=Flavobacterium crocinum TaxID=2183896 RepID=A0A2S1YGN4_9FLAO|nr:porin [Flavobacterium crocinum]AWK03205.1 porin [Flavobacterium crocinum]
MIKRNLLAVLLLLTFAVNAQESNKQELNKQDVKNEVMRILDSINKAKLRDTESGGGIEEHWYDRISLRGYAQIRYNGLFSTNDKVSCEQCDKSWGTTSTAPDAKANNGLFIRRARLVFSGQVHPNVFFYFQPDFASSPSTGIQNFVQIRDLYFDLSFDKLREYRVRVGQSKIPYGFENMQSSSQRLTMDRADAINSSILNERDLGIFFYWAPAEIRKRFEMLVKDGYKGSGDFGVFAFGVYNGQIANKLDGNRDLNVVTRVTYPFVIGSQIIEPGIQAYTGKWAFTGEISSGVTVNDPQYVKDQRVGATFVLYPRPFGIQTEYNIGKGPRYNTVTNTVDETDLNGGYVLLNYKWDIKKQRIYPFAKFQYYDGGKKYEKDARSYVVRDYEFGIEWQPIKAFELTAEYVVADRTFEDSALPINRQQGNVLRLQAQFNF